MTKDELIASLQKQNESLKRKLESKNDEVIEMKSDLKLTISTFGESFGVLGIDIHNMEQASTSSIVGGITKMLPQIMTNPASLSEKFSGLMALAPLVGKYEELF
jgi:hypothetical protein